MFQDIQQKKKKATERARESERVSKRALVTAHFSLLETEAHLLVLIQVHPVFRSRQTGGPVRCH